MLPAASHSATGTRLTFSSTVSPGVSISDAFSDPKWKRSTRSVTSAHAEILMPGLFSSTSAGPAQTSRDHRINLIV